MTQPMFSAPISNDFPNLKQYFSSVEFVSAGISHSTKANNYRVVFKGNTKLEPYILVTENRSSGMVHLMPSMAPVPGWGAHVCWLEGLGTLGLRNTDITIVSMEAYIMACTFVIKFIEDSRTKVRKAVQAAKEA
jgi:hypothetical protein